MYFKTFNLICNYIYNYSHKVYIMANYGHKVWMLQTIEMPNGRSTVHFEAWKM